MFGMGFGELVLVIIVAIVMIGPKDLPRVLRTAGQWAGKVRRMALDLRVQSGIDDILHNEGLTEDLREIRKLARGELDGIRQAATISLDNTGPAPATASSDSHDGAYPDINMSALRYREYPREGADSYNAMPDTSVVYVDALTKSPLARDPLYVTGDPNGELPPLPPEPEPAREREPDVAIATQIGMPVAPEVAQLAQAVPPAPAAAATETDAPSPASSASPRQS